MKSLHFVALPTAAVEALRNGSADAFGLTPEGGVSDGGLPCRHCLADIEAGDPYLLLAYRPFPGLQPYAEAGPIFLHAAPCRRYPESAALPPMLLSRTEVLVRGYGIGNRIVAGTGRVVSTRELPEAAAALLEDPAVAYVHVRSATNNCYSCRIDAVWSPSPARGADRNALMPGPDA